MYIYIHNICANMPSPLDMCTNIHCNTLQHTATHLLLLASAPDI